MHLGSILSNLFFPTSCAVCDRPGSALCTHCLQSIPLADTTERNDIFAVFDYGNHTVQRIIRSAKYYRKSEGIIALSKAAAPHIVEYIGGKLQSLTPQTIILVPIPQHKRKTHARGFNQSEIIARTLKESIEGATMFALLEKKRATKPQAHIHNKRERLQNLIGSMHAKKSLGRTSLYIVVDDVTTTGATCIEAIRAIKNSGAHNVLAVALAHGYAKR